jgi:serine/threonine protein phosphatase PrpC
VFDGHAGAGTADIASRIFEYAFRRSLEVNDSDVGAVEMTIRLLVKFLADRDEGSSASVAWIDEIGGRATIGTLGDSPVVVRGADGRTVVGPLHNVFLNEEDRDRAIERGATFMGGYLVDPKSYEGVNLTRTIGDAALTFLGREPETMSASLGPASYVLVGTDGLFTPDASDPDELIARIDTLVDSGANAEAIVDDALESGSEDNVTVVLWRPVANGSPETSSPDPASEVPGGPRSG